MQSPQVRTPHIRCQGKLKKHSSLINATTKFMRHACKFFVPCLHYVQRNTFFIYIRRKQYLEVAHGMFLTCRVGLLTDNSSPPHLFTRNIFFQISCAGDFIAFKKKKIGPINFKMARIINLFFPAMLGNDVMVNRKFLKIHF